MNSTVDSNDFSVAFLVEHGCHPQIMLAFLWFLLPLHDCRLLSQMFFLSCCHENACCHCRGHCSDTAKVLRWLLLLLLRFFALVAGLLCLKENGKSQAWLFGAGNCRQVAQGGASPMPSGCYKRILAKRWYPILVWVLLLADESNR